MNVNGRIYDAAQFDTTKTRWMWGRDLDRSQGFRRGKYLERSREEVQKPLSSLKLQGVRDFSPREPLFCLLSPAVLQKMLSSDTTGRDVDPSPRLEIEYWLLRPHTLSK